MPIVSLVQEISQRMRQMLIWRWLTTIAFVLHLVLGCCGEHAAHHGSCQDHAESHCEHHSYQQPTADIAQQGAASDIPLPPDHCSQQHCLFAAVHAAGLQPVAVSGATFVLSVADCKFSTPISASQLENRCSLKVIPSGRRHLALSVLLI